MFCFGNRIMVFTVYLLLCEKFLWGTVSLFSAKSKLVRRPIIWMKVKTDTNYATEQNSLFITVSPIA